MTNEASDASIQNIMERELRWPKVGSKQACILCHKATATFLGVKGGQGQWKWPPFHQTIEQCRALRVTGTGRTLKQVAKEEAQRW